MKKAFQKLSFLILSFVLLAQSFSAYAILPLPDPIQAKFSLEQTLQKFLPFSWQFIIFAFGGVQNLKPFLALPAAGNILPSTEQGFTETRFSQYLPANSAEIQLWLPGDSSAALRQTLQDLETRFPKLTVKMTPFADQVIYWKELQKAFVSGSAPDIFLVNTAQLKALSAQNILAPAPQEILSSDLIRSDFFPLAQDFIRNEYAFAAPLFGNFLLLFGNSALLNDQRIFLAGKPGQTWAQLYTNAQKFTEFGDQKVTFISFGKLETSETLLRLFLLLLNQARAESMTARAAHDALAFLLDLATPYFKKYKGDELTPFLDGKVALYFGDEATFAKIKQALSERKRADLPKLRLENLKLFPLPQYTAAEPQTSGEAYGFAVAKASAYPKLSWALAALLTNTRNSEAHFLKTGLTSLRKDVPNELFSESAALTPPHSQWQKLDFAALFHENVLALFPKDPKAGVPTLDSILEKFAAFFAS